MHASFLSHLYARAFVYANLGNCIEVYDWSKSSLREHHKIAIYNDECVSGVVDDREMSLTVISGLFTTFKP